jgi:aspartyl-tRNA(Asn)/glutamyl-tRNA(Gln) amidotransferase subunit C
VSISLEEVRHIAALARLALDDAQARAAAADLSSILDHMQILSRADTENVPETASNAQPGMILRRDAGPPIPLERAPVSFAPAMRDGFFLVPRLATHEDMESSS